MFSEHLRHYAQSMILWTSFWVLALMVFTSGWGYFWYQMGDFFYPNPDTGRIPFCIAWLTGEIIFMISYFNILGKWQEERKEQLEAQKKARRYA